MELIAASAAMGERWESLRNRFDLSADNTLTIELAIREHLHLLTAPSRFGLLSLGFVTDAPLPESQVTTIKEHFQRTLEKEGTE